ncbi:MAG: hypothetical protein ACKO3N_10835 [Verrucomicrobiota bacterium]
MPTSPSRHRPIPALLTLLSLLLSRTPATADPTRPADSCNWESARRLTESVGRVVRAVGQLPQQNPFGYDAGVSILSTFLAPGGEARVTHPFRAGRRYLLIGGADAQTSDMDIVILDAQGRPLAEDRLVDATPRMTYRAQSTGPHTIKISAFGTRPACCTLVVLAEDGIRLPASHLSEALDGVLQGCQAVGQSAPVRIAFRPEPAGWILWGGVCRPKQGLEIPGVQLGVGRRAVVGAGDSQARQIDLCVLTPREEVLARGAQDTATPVVPLKTQAPLEARLQLRSVHESSPSLVLAAILNLHPGPLD